MHADEETISDEAALEKLYFKTCLQLVGKRTKRKLDYIKHIDRDYLYKGINDVREPREFVADVEQRICRVGGSRINEKLSWGILFRSVDLELWYSLDPDEIKTYLGAVKTLGTVCAVPGSWDFKLIFSLTQAKNISELARKLRVMKSVKSDVKLETISLLVDSWFPAVGSTAILMWVVRACHLNREAFNLLQQEGWIDHALNLHPLNQEQPAAY